MTSTSPSLSFSSAAPSAPGWSSARRGSVPNTEPRGTGASASATFSSASIFRSYLTPDLSAGSPDLEGQIRARSPRTPSSAQFEQMQTTLNVPDLEREHHLYPSAYSRQRNTTPKIRIPPPPAQQYSLNGHGPTRMGGKRQAYHDTPKNIPSRPIPRDGWARTMPRPSRVIRVLTVVAVLAVGALLVLRISATQVMQLKSGAAGINSHDIIRRGEKGRYEPPQIRSVNMMDRVKAPRATHAALNFAAHPIPSTHELLALQSYLLQSTHNVLPPRIDPSKPLDGNTILAISPSKLGEPGSALQAVWLRDLEREREEDVVIWAPAGASAEAKAISDLIEALSVEGRTPLRVNLEGRSDASLIGAILGRLGISSAIAERPMVMLANKPIYGGKAELEKMRDAGELQPQLEAIGWLDGWKATHLEDGDERKEAEKKEEEEKALKPKIMNAAFHKQQ